MPKNWYSIKAAQGAETAEVSILSEIGYWGVTAQQFIRDLREQTAQASTIKVFINSPGGSVFDGVAIANALRSSGKQIHVQVLGIAASIASVIAMAGHKVSMPRNTMMFVHDPISAVYGNAEELRAAAEDLDKVRSSLVSTYMARFKGTEQELSDLLAAESYLTADECLAHGFADEVTDPIAMEAKFDIEQLPEHVRKLFEARKPPEPPVVRDPSLAQRIQALATEHGVEDLLPLLALDARISDAASAATVVQQAADIVRFCALAGLPEQAEPLVRATKSVPEARAALLDLRAEASPPIDNTRKPPKAPVSGGEFSSKSIWAEIEANKARSYK